MGKIELIATSTFGLEPLWLRRYGILDIQRSR